MMITNGELVVVACTGPSVVPLRPSQVEEYKQVRPLAVFSPVVTCGSDAHKEAVSWANALRDEYIKRLRA